MKRIVLSIVCASGIVAIVVGCGSTTVSTTAVTSSGASHGAASKAAAKAAPAHVGATIAVSGSTDKLHVQVSQVLDPAPIDPNFGPDAGKKVVAVKLVLTNVGTAAASDDANNEVAVIGSDNQTYSSAFDPITGCTNFDAGDYRIIPGATSTGCVAFELPAAVKVAKVQFTANSGFGDAGEWLNP